ncbi:MAG: peptide-methionine (R)-S-oxide reductase MsrB [Scrofimicrobium sp.]
MSYPKTEEEWKVKLTPFEFQVLRNAATERPGTGDLLDEERPGTYYCKGCGQKLFDAGAKFDAGCGWPSFFRAYSGATSESTDYLLGYPRTEIRCSNCGSHLGHVFPDAPQTPTGMRYCMNSVALTFEPADEGDPEPSAQ